MGNPLTSFDVSPEGAETQTLTGTLEHLEMTMMQVKFAVKNLLPVLKEVKEKAGFSEWRLTELAYPPTESYRLCCQQGDCSPFACCLSPVTAMYRCLAWWDARFRGNFLLNLLTPIFEGLYCLCLGFLDFFRWLSGGNRKKKGKKEEPEEEEDSEDALLSEPESEQRSGDQPLLGC